MDDVRSEDQMVR